MRRRKLLGALAGALVILVLIVADGLLLWPAPRFARPPVLPPAHPPPPQQSRVTKENFDRIKEGMSRAEVEAIFGGPAGDFRTTGRERNTRPIIDPDGTEPEEWVSDTISTWIEFSPGPGGKVVRKEAWPVRSP
jgi:hypothetical protein